MRTFRTLLIGLCFSASTLSADGDELAGYRASYPEQVAGIEHLSICPTRTRKGHFSYGDSNLGINKTISSGGYGVTSIIAGLRNVQLRLGSKIHNSNTTYGVVGVDSTLTSLESWQWQALLLLQPDLRNTSLTRSTRYIGSLHGIYEATQTVKLHVGAYAELGMRAPNIQPIIGAEYLSGPWVFEATYPIRAGVSFVGIAHHRLSAMVRPFYTAVRVNRGVSYRPAIVTYDGAGGEVRWDWTAGSRCNLWVAVGSTVFGTMTIGNKDNNHRLHIHVHRAPYAQIGCTFGL